MDVRARGLSVRGSGDIGGDSAVISRSGRNQLGVAE